MNPVFKELIKSLVRGNVYPPPSSTFNYSRFQLDAKDSPCSTAELTTRASAGMMMIAVQSSIMVGKFATFLLVPRLEAAISSSASITNCLNNRHREAAFMYCQAEPRFRDLDDDFLAPATSSRSLCLSVRCLQFKRWSYSNYEGLASCKLQLQCTLVP